MYACLPQSYVPEPNTDWLYMPAGLAECDCDEIIDISDISDKKLEIMSTHLSQKSDMEIILSRSSETLLREYYCYFRD